jgi:hypothetical protein
VLQFLWMLPPSSAARDIELAHRAARWAAASPARHEAALKLIELLAGRSPVRVEAVADGVAAPEPSTPLPA